MEQVFIINQIILETLDAKGFYKDLNGYPAITHQEVIDWLYEKGISLEIHTCSDDGGKSFNHLIRKVGKSLYEIRALDNKCVSNRYKAFDKGIIEALKLIK